MLWLRTYCIECHVCAPENVVETLLPLTGASCIERIYPLTVIDLRVLERASGMDATAYWETEAGGRICYNPNITNDALQHLYDHDVRYFHWHASRYFTDPTVLYAWYDLDIVQCARVDDKHRLKQYLRTVATHLTEPALNKIKYRELIADPVLSTCSYGSYLMCCGGYSIAEIRAKHGTAITHYIASRIGKHANDTVANIVESLWVIDGVVDTISAGKLLANPYIDAWEFVSYVTKNLSSSALQRLHRKVAARDGVRPKIVELFNLAGVAEIWQNMYSATKINYRGPLRAICPRDIYMDIRDEIDSFAAADVFALVVFMCDGIIALDELVTLRYTGELSAVLFFDHAVASPKAHPIMIDAQVRRILLNNISLTGLLYRSGQIFELLYDARCCGRYQQSCSHEDLVFEMYERHNRNYDLDAPFVFEWINRVVVKRGKSDARWLARVREAGIRDSYSINWLPLTPAELATMTLSPDAGCYNPNLSLESLQYLRDRGFHGINWSYYGRGPEYEELGFVEGDGQAMRLCCELFTYAYRSRPGAPSVQQVREYLRHYDDSDPNCGFLSTDDYCALSTEFDIGLGRLMCKPGFTLTQLHAVVYAREAETVQNGHRLRYIVNTYPTVARNCNDNAEVLLQLGCDPEELMKNRYVDVDTIINAFLERYRHLSIHTEIDIRMLAGLIRIVKERGCDSTYIAGRLITADNVTWMTEMLKPIIYFPLPDGVASLVTQDQRLINDALWWADVHRRAAGVFALVVMMCDDFIALSASRNSDEFITLPLQARTA